MTARTAAVPGSTAAAARFAAGARYDMLPPEARQEAVRSFVDTRVTAGSRRPDEVRRVLGACRKRLAGQRAWVDDRRHAVAGAEHELRRAAAAIKSPA